MTSPSPAILPRAPCGGACHDGSVAFGRTEGSCPKCHSGSLDSGKEGLAQLKRLPKAKFGNQVDWVAALAGGLIRPAISLSADYRAMVFDKSLSLEAEWSIIPPAVFPHAAHLAWLDCESCHPAVFNIQKKTTKHFSMGLILERQFCGACHLNVAFPLDDCKRCHPAMRE